MKTKQTKQIDIRRAALIQLSVKARAYREEQLQMAQSADDFLLWSQTRINDIIADWYRNESGAKEFRTFKQWKEEGYIIKKGSKAYILWSRKRKATKAGEAPEGNDPNTEEYEFFPIAYLFSDLQVEKGEARNVN